MSKKDFFHFTASDTSFMRRALDLARKGMGKTRPNPMVGAVLAKNGKIMSEAYHHKAGKEHAEVLALRGLSKAQVQGATLYVTLEPCCHVKKRTPPCVNFLAKSGLKDLVIATKDPNPLVNGRGIAFLKKAGVKVRVGLLAAEAVQLNEIFFKNMHTPLPFVVLKLAQSLDGKIATSQGDSRWITDELSRKYVHTLRSQYDAIISSSTTVVMDNPHFSVRMVKGRNPLRIIIDRKLKTDTSAHVYADQNCLLVTTQEASQKKRKLFESAHIPLKVYPSHFSLSKLLKDLRTMGIQSIMIEAGGVFASAFIQEKLVDKFLFFIAPKIIGGDGKNSIGELGIKKIKKIIAFHNVRWKRLETDIFIEAYPH